MQINVVSISPLLDRQKDRLSSLGELKYFDTFLGDPDLQEKLNSETKAKYFWFEPDPMYTKRESELIQQFLQQFGKMPEGDGEGDDLDDLF